MKRLTIGAAIAVLAISSTMAQPAKGRAAVDQCLAKWAAELDDGRSDARTIAAAVTASCITERQRMFTDGGITIEGAQRAVRESREQAIDEATAIVLMTRTKAKR